jgi:tetratricopeptide (TPR) repeat protein
MKKAVMTIVLLSVFLSGICFAQSEGDQAYIKAMQANSPQEKAALLKDYVSKYAGKGGQYDGFAYSFLFLSLIQTGKSDAETLGYGEKALTIPGVEDIIKGQILMTLASVYAKNPQTADKAKQFANQLIQHAASSKVKEAEAANAATWNGLTGGAHYVLGQAAEKSKDYKGAVESFLNAYNILKDKKILGEIKHLGKSLYDSGDMADAEKVFRVTYNALQDADSLTLLAQSLYKQGKQAEAMAMFKEGYGRKKTGEMAYNIGVMLAKEAKTNPSLNGEAIKYLLDAAVLGTKVAKEAQQAMEIAQSLFFSQDKEWNNRVKQIQDSNKLIEDWAKTLNTKYKDKSEDDLSSDEKREFRRLNESIEKEKKIVEGIQAQQKATMDGFNKALAEAKARNGK